MGPHLKVIGKKNIFKKEFLSLSEVTLQLRNGDTKIHYNAERVSTVAVFPITEAGDIYLVSQYRYLHDKTLLEAVAGTIDMGEKPFETAKRELHEEAGIRALSWQEIAVVDLAASYVKAKTFLFLARDLTLGDHAQEEDEEITIKKMSIDEAVEKVMQGEITTASSIIGILMIDKLKKEGEI